MLLTVLKLALRHGVPGIHVKTISVHVNLLGIIALARLSNSGTGAGQLTMSSLLNGNTILVWSSKLTSISDSLAWISKKVVVCGL